MVLQERIELSTSPLPRECSTTELLQHAGAGTIGGACRDGASTAIGGRSTQGQKAPNQTLQMRRGSVNAFMSKSDQAKARELRLAEKLRDNLRRRKAQLKARSQGEPGVQADGAAASVPADPSGTGSGNDNSDA